MRVDNREHELAVRFIRRPKVVDCFSQTLAGTDHDDASNDDASNDDARNGNASNVDLSLHGGVQPFGEERGFSG